MPSDVSASPPVSVAQTPPTRPIFRMLPLAGNTLPWTSPDEAARRERIRARRERTRAERGLSSCCEESCTWDRAPCEACEACATGQVGPWPLLIPDIGTFGRTLCFTLGRVDDPGRATACRMGHPTGASPGASRLVSDPQGLQRLECLPVDPGVLPVGVVRHRHNTSLCFPGRWAYDRPGSRRRRREIDTTRRSNSCPSKR